MKPQLMIKESEFLEVLKKGYNESKKNLTIIGHCRLTTDGSYAEYENNHPIETNSFVGVHNGIVLNAVKLSGFKTTVATSKEQLLALNDTLLFFKKINELQSQIKHLPKAISTAYSLIEGSASIGLLDKSGNIILATNTGSLYYSSDENSNEFLFASESNFLKLFKDKSGLFQNSPITQLKPGTGIGVSKKAQLFEFSEEISNPQVKLESHRSLHNIEIRSTPNDLKRCKRCILPETYPFISFDDKGVCNFCNRFVSQKYYGEEKLEEYLAPYRSKDGSPDCLIGLSGGRDSCYGIYTLVKQFGMHPITYTYDWGLTTDTSRRNQSKLCAKLGLEHVIRAADIQKKRRNIQQNISAWLRKPELGMVPLFMAGDKDFYQLGRTLRKQLRVPLTVFCSGHLLEQREFFVGFCGVNENVTSTARTYDYNLQAKAKLAFYYISQYVKNPFYINESFLDSVRSYFTTFLFKDDFLYLFEFLPWNEKEIEAVLKKEMDWEADKSYGKNQWRMGDGQTAFTNYIYYQLAGFTEFDNFRSNQIREGLISREEAVELVKEDNKPKIETLQYFSYLVGFNLDTVLAKINILPKLY